MNERIIAVEMVSAEITHLTALVEQFAELIDTSSAAEARSDPAVRRLVPDGYADPEAAREFRALTENDLLERRASDAAAVLGSLATVDATGGTEDAVVVALDTDTARAWLRTLAAIRLVLATRLGITDEDDHDAADPRFGIYDWLGYRLDALVTVLDPS